MGTDDLDTLYALTEKQVRGMLLSKVYDRAEAYYRSGRVSHARTVGASLLANVKGTHLYNTSVKVEDGLLVTSCTCPFADTAPCKHVGALLLQWVRDRDSFAICDDEQDSTDSAAQATLATPRYEPLDAAPGSRGRGDGNSLEGDDSNGADSEEEQSGLITLLEPLPFTGLRDIARQRGWRVKTTSKADYVTALAALLCDPTETARAVTAMPDDLREALRAAFVADDGSGIRATTMAQAMTALRGGPGPTVKPVEAAGLLSDLARWGLVLPWRDSLYNNGSYVLPWEVQRLVPPLPGWCPPGPQAAAAPTQFRDVRQVVNSLYAVWESIADEEPALRPPPEDLGERPLQSMLQGWPYDPRELQGRAGKRGRVQTAVQAFSVPPAPFLLDDASLPALARVVAGDDAAGTPSRHLSGEKAEFLCRVLRELDLISVQNGHLIAQREAMAGFLRRPVPEQHRAVGQAYLSLMDWSEMDALLRQDNRLVLWRKPYFPVPYDHFRSSLVRLRHLLLRFLACSGEAGSPPRVSGQGWCRVTDLEAALRELWPRFPEALQSERQSWISQAWGLLLRPAEAGLVLPRPKDGETSRPAEAGLASRQAGSLSPDKWRESGTLSRFGEGSGPDTAKEPDWESSQGAFLRLMLEGPLYWLGFAELGYRDGTSLAAGQGQLVAVRFHGLANWIWDRPTAALEEMQPGEALTIDEATGTIAMPPAAVPPQAHTFLGRIARLEEASPGRFVYRLFQRAAYATFESGVSLSDLILEWEQVMPQPIPPALQDILSQWWTRYGQVRLYDGFGLLELCDEVTLRELEAGTSLTQHIVARLSPRLVLVPDEAVGALMREFTAKGYTPKEVE